MSFTVTLTNPKVFTMVYTNPKAYAFEFLGMIFILTDDSGDFITDDSNNLITG